MLQAYSCHSVTGEILDTLPVPERTYNRLLSAGGEGAARVMLDGTHSQAQLRDLTNYWSRIVVLERDGVVEYGGYILGRSYNRGAAAIDLTLGDFWSMMARRGSWDHGAANVAKWSTTVNGSLAIQASSGLARARDTGPTSPERYFPMTIPGQGGPGVSRKYFGYHLQTLDDLFTDLLDEGLDCYYRPRWHPDSPVFNWLWQAGEHWGSGVTREFYVTADDSDVTGFAETGDAARVTNNARTVGEGTEQDILVRSVRNSSSPFPLLDRVSASKNVSDTGQLAAMSTETERLYRSPTVQWEFTVLASSPVDVGDTVRLHFDGDPWIPDGWHTRRVVRVTGDQSSQKTIAVQATGGA